MDAKTMSMVRAALDANVPFLCWGPPGTAKTAMLNGEGARRALTVHSVNLSHYEPAEVNGWLVPDPKDDIMRRKLPDWLADCCAKPCLLFLDELSTTPPATQAAALRLIQERRAGGRAFHPETRIGAAANPPSIAAGGWDLSAPAANRFVHIQWRVDFDSWARWLSAYGPGKPALRASVIGYIQASGRARLCAPPSSEAAQGQAWPSPRSWTNLCALLSVTPPGPEKEFWACLAEGCVGPGEATAFVEYLKHQDLPDPEALLADPAGWKIPQVHAHAYASLCAVVSAVADDCTGPRWLAAMRLHRLVHQAGIADLAASSAMPLLRLRLGAAKEGLRPRPELAKVPLPAKDIAPFRSLVELAGVMGAG